MNTPIREWPAHDWPTHRFGLATERWERLRSRHFWITGAGTGFGKAIAVSLACAGAQVFISGRRREKLLETVAEADALGADPARIIPICADITDEDQVVSACATIRDRCPTLHGLINNAAMPQRRSSPWPLQQQSLDFWEQMFRLNVTAQWLVTSKIMPHMVAGGEVRTVFISSGAGWAFTPGVGQYNVAKAALNNLGASFAHECAAAHPNADVQINVINPGEARTEMNQGSQRSPYTLVPMMLLLLAHPPGGPNGRFFHADGRHLSFADATAYDRQLDGSIPPATLPPVPPTPPLPPRSRLAMIAARLLRRSA